ncbi:hypothetical protein L3X07_12790 [Levilactobacillus brevis]|nr:hypothetical protein [Levilactobacillus brevis]
MKGKHLGILVGAAVVIAGGLAACGTTSKSTNQSGQLAAKQVVNLSTKSEVTTLDVSKAADSVSLTRCIIPKKACIGWGKRKS